ncbi:MAG: pyridoxamine 5'-phosphate oxidase family protein [Rhizobiales bacterium]|nr:pyridoxamine 5'-phosphate oxidase family protein [Hyphomicrobiales bacterium]
MTKITTIEQLEALYKPPTGLTITKEIDFINDQYRQFIEASPFCILSTYGEKGIDCTPRGDPYPLVRITDSKTILLPDRKGNNRVDNMRNIIENSQVGLIFLVPNAGETIRVAGRAEIIVDVELNESFAIKGKPATSVLRISVDKIYFHCSKALIRSALWKSETYIDRKTFPTAGQMGKAIDQSFDGETYDRNLPERYKKTLY